MRNEPPIYLSPFTPDQLKVLHNLLTATDKHMIAHDGYLTYIDNLCHLLSFGIKHVGDKDVMGDVTLHVSDLLCFLSKINDVVHDYKELREIHQNVNAALKQHGYHV